MEDGSESPPMDQDTDQMSPMQDSGPLPVKQSAFDQLTSESTDESGVANGNNGNNQDDFQMGGMEGSHNPNQEGDDDAQEMQEEPAPSAPKDSGDTFGMLISNFQAVKKDKPPTPPPAAPPSPSTTPPSSSQTWLLIVLVGIHQKYLSTRAVPTDCFCYEIK